MKNEKLGNRSQANQTINHWNVQKIVSKNKKKILQHTYHVFVHYNNVRRVFLLSANHDFVVGSARKSAAAEKFKVLRHAYGFSLHSVRFELTSIDQFSELQNVGDESRRGSKLAFDVGVVLLRKMMPGLTLTGRGDRYSK